MALNARNARRRGLRASARIGVEAPRHKRHHARNVQFDVPSTLHPVPGTCRCYVARAPRSLSCDGRDITGALHRGCRWLLFKRGGPPIRRGPEAQERKRAPGPPVVGSPPQSPLPALSVMPEHSPGSLHRRAARIRCPWRHGRGSRGPQPPGRAHLRRSVDREPEPDRGAGRSTGIGRPPAGRRSGRAQP